MVMTDRVSYAEFSKNLAKYMDQTSGSPLHIERANAGSVVMMSEDEFESWKETIYLLRSPANAQELMKAILEAEAGEYQEHGLIQE